MEIKLIPHVGIKEVPGKASVEVTLAQDQVMVDGARVGYAPHGKGNALILLGELPESTVEAIKAHMDNRDGIEAIDRKVSVPPALGDIEPSTEDSDDE